MLRTIYNIVEQTAKNTKVRHVLLLCGWVQRALAKKQPPVEEEK